MTSKKALERIGCIPISSEFDKDLMISESYGECYDVIDYDLSKLQMYESHMYNLHNKETIICPPFSSVVGNLKQEDKYRVYENNYYLLMETLKENEELKEAIASISKIIKGVDNK